MTTTAMMMPSSFSSLGDPPEQQQQRQLGISLQLETQQLQQGRPSRHDDEPQEEPQQPQSDNCRNRSFPIVWMYCPHVVGFTPVHESQARAVRKQLRDVLWDDHHNDDDGNDNPPLLSALETRIAAWRQHGVARQDCQTGVFHSYSSDDDDDVVVLGACSASLDNNKNSKNNKKDGEDRTTTFPTTSSWEWIAIPYPPTLQVPSSLVEETSPTTTTPTVIRRNTQVLWDSLWWSPQPQQHREASLPNPSTNADACPAVLLRIEAHLRRCNQSLEWKLRMGRDVWHGLRRQALELWEYQNWQRFQRARQLEQLYAVRETLQERYEQARVQFQRLQQEQDQRVARLLLQEKQKQQQQQSSSSNEEDEWDSMDIQGTDGFAAWFSLSEEQNNEYLEYHDDDHDSYKEDPYHDGSDDDDEVPPHDDDDDDDEKRLPVETSDDLVGTKEDEEETPPVLYTPQFQDIFQNLDKPNQKETLRLATAEGNQTGDDKVASTAVGDKLDTGNPQEDGTASLSNNGDGITGDVAPPLVKEEQEEDRDVAVARQRRQQQRSEREALLRKQCTTHEYRLAQAMAKSLRERVDQADELLESLQEEEWQAEEEREQEEEAEAAQASKQQKKKKKKKIPQNESSPRRGVSLLDQLLVAVLGSLPPPLIVNCHPGSTTENRDACTTSHTLHQNPQEYQQWLQEEHRAIVQEWLETFGSLPPPLEQQAPAQESTETEIKSVSGNQHTPAPKELDSAGAGTTVPLERRVQELRAALQDAEAPDDWEDQDV